MRYREQLYKKELEDAIEVINDISDLVDEVKRKTSSKSAHKVLEQITTIIEVRKESAFEVLNSLGRR